MEAEGVMLPRDRHYQFTDHSDTTAALGSLFGDAHVDFGDLCLNTGTVWRVNSVKGWMRADPNPFPRIRLFPWWRP